MSRAFRQAVDGNNSAYASGTFRKRSRRAGTFLAFASCCCTLSLFFDAGVDVALSRIRTNAKHSLHQRAQPSFGIFSAGIIEALMLGPFEVHAKRTRSFAK